jgi:Icc-related predicted phosphoesterase
MKRIWVISDTHALHEDIEVPPDIDLVIHAGDAGTSKNPTLCEEDLRIGLKWLNELPIKDKVYVPGNHDTALEAGLIDLMEYENIYFLLHESIVIDGIHIFGSPYTPHFNNWAYNVAPKNLKRTWENIPTGVDILITHGPPKGILDRCQDGYKAGCEELKLKVQEIKPKIHIFGHIHECGGLHNRIDGTHYINASVLDAQYALCNNGHVIYY